MNCQQVQGLIDDVIDGHLARDVRRQVDCHLASCLVCRMRFDTERDEHLRWVRALKDAETNGETLSSAFAERLVAKVSATPARRAAFNHIPCWVRVAACVAMAVSLTALGAWTLGLVSDNSHVSAFVDDPGLPYEPCASFLSAIYLLGLPNDAATSSKPSCITTQEEHPMKQYLALAASAMSAAAVSGVTALASTPSCIVSGTTARSCSSLAWATATDLDSRVSTWGLVVSADAFDTRVRTCGYGDALETFRSDAPGFILIIH